MCGQLICKETEYEARNLTIVSAVAAPNAAPCKTAANQTTAEGTAKDQVKNDVKDQGEKIDTCTPGGCRCGEWGAWVAWRKIDTGLQSTQTVPIGAACTWTVVVKYDRFFRKREADCHPAPIAMAPRQKGAQQRHA